MGRWFIKSERVIHLERTSSGTWAAPLRHVCEVYEGRDQEHLYSTKCQSGKHVDLPGLLGRAWLIVEEAYSVRTAPGAVLADSVVASSLALCDSGAPPACLRVCVSACLRREESTISDGHHHPPRRPPLLPPPAPPRRSQIASHSHPLTTASQREAPPRRSPINQF